MLVLLSSILSIVSATETIKTRLVGESTVLTTLSFQNEIEVGPKPLVNFRNFPPLIYTLANKHKEGTISFTKGVWDDSLWSAPTFSTKTSGFELELAAGITDEKSFKETINAISGYFCSSVSRLTPGNVFINDDGAFASLQQEALCTENLQPFIDLLPCRDVSGLASMLRPEALHRSEYYSMQVHFHKHLSKISFSASIYLVNDLNRWNRQGKYVLTNILGKTSDGTCGQCTVDAFGNIVRLEDAERQPISLPSKIPPPRPVRAFLVKSGFGDLDAGLLMKIDNDLDAEAKVNVLLRIPWMFRPVWHAARGYGALKSFKLTPAKFDRRSSAFVEIEFAVPSKSAVVFQVPLEREFLRIDEFPENSERGIDFPPARIEVEGVESESASGKFSTNGLVFTWPIPDNTMPFNVITMSATAVALFYGAMFNMICRRFYLRHPDDAPSSPLLKLLWKLKRWLRKQPRTKQ